MNEEIQWISNEEIQWISEVPARSAEPGARYGRTQAFVRALKSNPNIWAVYPYPTKCSTSVYKKMHPGTEWCYRTVDGKQIIYVRWVGETK